MNDPYEGELDPEKHIGRYINRLSKDIRYSINGYISEKGYNMTGEQCRIMGYIKYWSEKGSCVYQKDIENDFGIKRSSVASILANMEKGGYIVREVDSSDARLKRVSLTEDGQRLQREIGLTIEFVEEILSQGMTEKDKSELIRLSNMAINNLEASKLPKIKEKEIFDKC